MDKRWDIIVAEDDDDDLYIFKIIIEELPLHALLRRAKHGDELLQLLVTNIPDILFLDLLMPRKNGFECLKEIRNDRRYDNLPIVILTSFQSPESKRLCYDSGASRFMFKDADSYTLKSKVAATFTYNWQKSNLQPPYENFIINN